MTRIIFLFPLIAMLAMSPQVSAQVHPGQLFFFVQDSAGNAIPYFHNGKNINLDSAGVYSKHVADSLLALKVSASDTGHYSYTRHQADSIAGLKLAVKDTGKYYYSKHQNDSIAALKLAVKDTGLYYYSKHQIDSIKGTTYQLDTLSVLYSRHQVDSIKGTIPTILSAEGTMSVSSGYRRFTGLTFIVATTDSSVCRTYFPYAGTITGFAAHWKCNNTSGKTTFTLKQNGVDTPATFNAVTANGWVTGAWTGSVAVTANDYFCTKVVQETFADVSYVSVTIKFVPN